MNTTVMNFNRIRDLVFNLGFKDNSGRYIPRLDCLQALEKLEDELLNEDEGNRNVRITVHICGTVKKHLLPILASKEDAQLIAVTTRILVNLSLPVEYLSSNNNLRRIKRVQKHVFACTLAIKNAFFNVAATLALVTILRETIIKSEKYSIPLSNEECKHLNNCLLLLRNILHLPDLNSFVDENSVPTLNNWKSVQSKLIWNLFVQGIDGPLLLMLNSKYRKRWTAPLTLIMGSLYRNQNIDDVHHTLDLVSSASEDSENEQESDGSKKSYTSLSSDTSKLPDAFNDSGCPITTDENTSKRENGNPEQAKRKTLRHVYTVPEIRTDFEKVQISNEPCKTQKHQSHCLKEDQSVKLKVALSVDGVDYGDSSPCISPYHKRIKGNPRNSLNGGPSDDNPKCKRDSGLGEEFLLVDVMDSKSSDDDVFDTIPGKQTKTIQRLQSLQLISKTPESDSSNEDVRNKRINHRCPPPNVKRSKNSTRNSGCTPSVCLDSALEALYTRGRIRFPLWEKRNSVSTLVDIKSPTPSKDDIGNLLKEFTLSFLHCGFSKLVLDLKDLFLKGQHLDIDKSVLFWVVSYFLPLARESNISLDHIRDIISVGFIGILVFESVIACENLEIHSFKSEKCLQYATIQIKLIVIALKDVLSTVDSYSQKINSPKDRAFFNKLNGKLAGLQDIRNLPLLLLQMYPLINDESFLEDVALLNHLILIIIGRGVRHCFEPKKVNFVSHLKLFSSENVVQCYGKLLENFRTNSEIINDCVFTMMHHLSGDIRSLELLYVPIIIKTFSDILEEEFKLNQYQEDVVMYVLNQFTFKTCQEALENGQEQEQEKEQENASDDASNFSCASSYSLTSESDGLYWWYLRYEQDKDPISRIAEHISMTKQDILLKLKLKGYISLEKYTQLTDVMEEAEDSIAAIDFRDVPNIDEDITNLLQTLVYDGQQHHVLWVQDVLRETCFVKQGWDTKLLQPVPFYSIKMMLSVPLVPYCEDQRQILQDDIFILLLKKLGLHLGSGVCKMYPRIPLYWTKDMLFRMASRLDPIREGILKNIFMIYFHLLKYIHNS